MEKFSELPLVKRADQYRKRDAIVASEGTFTYKKLLEASGRVASYLLGGVSDLEEMRVAFLIPPGFQYAAVLLGIWRAGGIAVPLSPLYPVSELEYLVEDSMAETLVAHHDFEKRVLPVTEKIGLRFCLTDDLLAHQTRQLPQVERCRRAMIIYTSGTTGKPKGVVHTHESLEAQMTSLVKSWEWTQDDVILNVLPLNHVHGIVNVLLCALWSGAACLLLQKFVPQQVWDNFINSHLTLFMAVPTIYSKLISFWEEASPDHRKAMSDACSKMRLMVSGSAPLPVKVFREWERVSGHQLLERYGMTETGMVLSNPLHRKRIPGYVGTPLPKVKVRLVGEDGLAVKPGVQGEIQVKGPGIFLEYWRNQDATKNSFQHGWFCTGDVAVEENRMYRILGRKSLDIIKSGGYKVSALEIEEVLCTHPDIEEVAVVGVGEEIWGEMVSAAVVLREGVNLSLDSLQTWARELLASYKVPTRMLVVDELPRNVVGKVSKPDVAKLFDMNNPG